ncbi:MAG: hypothetical protein J6Y78_05085 [Paludibacteraceae bacterium]|nr:hypothetical protein [Paludibacteraceae bacterium]
MRTVNHLYIIGNGFGLYHGLPTNYGHFRDCRILYAQVFREQIIIQREELHSFTFPHN